MAGLSCICFCDGSGASDRWWVLRADGLDDVALEPVGVSFAYRPHAPTQPDKSQRVEPGRVLGGVGLRRGRRDRMMLLVIASLPELTEGVGPGDRALGNAPEQRFQALVDQALQNLFAQHILIRGRNFLVLELFQHLRCFQINLTQGNHLVIDHSSNAIHKLGSGSRDRLVCSGLGLRLSHLGRAQPHDGHQSQ